MKTPVPCLFCGKKSDYGKHLPLPGDYLGFVNLCRRHKNAQNNYILNKIETERRKKYVQSGNR